MSFQTITTTNASNIQHTYRETTSGIYVLDGIAFGAPITGLKLSGAKTSGKITSFAVTAFQEYVPVDPSKTTFDKLTVTINVQSPKQATVEQIDDRVAGLSSWMNADIIRDLLLGKL